MTRLSPCETLLAVIQPSNISIIYLPALLASRVKFIVNSEYLILLKGPKSGEEF